MRYQVFEDINIDKIALLFETNDFLEALNQARKLAIRKVNRVYVYYNPVKKGYSDMCIAYDPMGKLIDM